MVRRRPTGNLHNAARLFLFAVPALVLVIGAFCWPIGLAFLRSVENVEVRASFPQAAAALRQWDGQGLPDPNTQALFAGELVAAAKARAIGTPSRRLNMEFSGFSGLLQKTIRLMPSTGGQNAEALIAADPRWGEPRYWLALRRASAGFTDHYFLTAFDLRRDDAGNVVAAPEDRSLYVGVGLRTLAVAVSVTALCLLVAYPMSFLLSTLRPALANGLLLLVLLPFWTSILVRTAAWLVLLQREGIVNSALLGIGLIGAPLPLIFNRFGVVVALTQVLLPYAILTLYAVMKGIDPRYMRAASALGAAPFQAFRRIYLPLTLPGIAASGLLVFILAIGSYVTPALVGGRNDQMLSYYIAFNINQTINWGLAGALSVVLFIVVVLLYALYARVARLDRTRTA